MNLQRNTKRGYKELHNLRMTTSQKQKNKTQLRSGNESEQQNTVSDECSECSGRIVEDEARGERVCDDCGLVISTGTIDRGAEWRSFNDSKSTGQKRRVGAPVTNTLHDKGLSTNIGWQNKDAHGAELSEKKKSQMGRLRKWNTRCKMNDSQDQNLVRALSEITRMGAALGVNKDVEETASSLYRQCLNKGMLPGRSIESMSSACLYIATRVCDTPRSLSEIHPVSQVSASQPNEKSELNRAYRYVLREFDLELKPVDPRKYLNRVLTGVNPNDTEIVRQTAVELLDAHENENMHSGCSPVSLAAAAVYAACGLHEQHITQTDVADIASVSTVTIRNRYQEMIAVYEDRDDVGHEFNP